MASVNECTAPLVAEYNARCGRPATPAIEAVFTIAAAPEARSSSSAARLTRATPTTLTSKTWCLLVRIGGYVALGADTGVVHQDIEPAEAFPDGADRRPDLIGVGDVAAQPVEFRAGQRLRRHVQPDHPGSARVQQACRGEPDPRSRPGHHRDEAVELAHAAPHHVPTARV